MLDKLFCISNYTVVIPQIFQERHMTKTIAKVLLMTLIASTVVACATPPAKAPITRKG